MSVTLITERKFNNGIYREYKSKRICPFFSTQKKIEFFFNSAGQPESKKKKEKKKYS